MCDLITTSADLLNVVKAASLAILAILLAWAMFYGVMVMRNFFRISKDTKDVVREAKEGVLLFKAKAESGAYLLKMLSKGVHKAADVVEEKMSERKKSSTKKTTRQKKK